MTSSPEDELLREWISSSQLLYYTVIIVSVLTLPALVLVYCRLRRSRLTHFCFAASIIGGNFILLATIFANVLTDQNAHLLTELIPGFVICKVSAFLVNSSSFFVHWLWVAMYLQTSLVNEACLVRGGRDRIHQCTLIENNVKMFDSEMTKRSLPNGRGKKLGWNEVLVWMATLLSLINRCVYVYYPLRAHRTLNRSKTIILTICILAIISQLWTPILITELSVSSDSASGTYCAEDPTIFGGNVMKYLIVTECMLTFFIPFILTVIADISVLVLRNPCGVNNYSNLTVIGADELVKGTLNVMPLKIMHRSKILCDQKKRTKAIRRFLILTTTTLLLNLPNYSLQLLDEFYHYRESNDWTVRRNFIRVDAFVYIIYLLQFPTVPVYMYWLKFDIEKRKTPSGTSRNRSSLV